nr:hypothetical protein [Tanacetum cinerariifolium]
MTTLADKAILSGADNRPPMLEKDMYDSWKSIMELYMMNRQHGRMILESVENGPLLWPTVKENGVTKPKKYSKIYATESIQVDCDVKATNIIFQGLPLEIYALVSNHKVSKEIWERIQLLMQGTSLKKQERKSEEPMQTTHDLVEPPHQEFDTGAADDQPIAEASQHHEWIQQQKKPPTPDHTLTPELLAGPTYELMKGSCKSLMELEFFIEEVYKATTDQLDWNNPEGQQYPHNLLKPLPLIPNSQDYGHIKWIEDLVPRMMWSQEPTNLTVEERFAFNVSLRMFTRSIVIQWRVEDLQLGVESYQKKLNLTKPDTYHSDLKRKEAYIAYSNLREFIYKNKGKHNRLMWIDELHKFSDGMLNDVHTALDDRLKAKDEKDHEKSGEVCWWEIVGGRLQDAITNHMI